ncbi:MAG TPA: TRAP transporter substrate-binding protein DctP, partial [Bacteroidota bacterium]|nr:TRAP transporter substrate-binding protein DctP [Bacteroidota bacterium]
EEYDAAVRKESGGRIGFKIYPGTIQGDDKQVLRKIKAGLLQSGGFTGVGLGEVAPKVRILESPFLIRSYAEADFMYKQFNDEFTRAIEDGGYVLLGWAEVGFVYVFTNTPVQKPDDLKALKMWTWEGDPIAETAFRVLGMSPIPLSLDQVLPSLQTGLINAVYTTPYAAIALQWYTKVKYMVNVPLTDAAGVVLISKKYYDALPQDLREILMRDGRTYMAKLTELTRKDNKLAIDELKKRGIIMTTATEDETRRYIDAGEESRKQLVGRLYTEDFLKGVEKAVADFRKTEKGVK